MYTDHCNLLSFTVCKVGTGQGACFSIRNIASIKYIITVTTLVYTFFLFQHFICTTYQELS